MTNYDVSNVEYLDNGTNLNLVINQIDYVKYKEFIVDKK